MNEISESRTDKKKKLLRQKIIQVAVELFTAQGYANTTMEQIAEVADIARKTLYNYFPHKEAIADAYVREISRDIAQESLEQLLKLPDTRSRLIQALNNAYSWVEINPELTGVVLAHRFKTTYQGQKSELTGTQLLMEKIIRRGQEEGEIRRDLSLTVTIMYLDLLRGSMVMDWLNKANTHPDIPPPQLSKAIIQLVDLVLFGILKNNS